MKIIKPLSNSSSRYMQSRLRLKFTPRFIAIAAPDITQRETRKNETK